MHWRKSSVGHARVWANAFRGCRHYLGRSPTVGRLARNDSITDRRQQIYPLFRHPLIRINAGGRTRSPLVTHAFGGSQLPLRVAFGRSGPCQASARNRGRLLGDSNASNGSRYAKRSTRKRTRIVECPLSGSELMSALRHARCQLRVDLSPSSSQKAIAKTWKCADALRKVPGRFSLKFRAPV